jgi:sulfite exporter TauE/SafE
MEPLLGIAGGLGLGLASTLHCAGMCGGLSASLLHFGNARSATDAIRIAALTHTGRIISYALAGALAGSIGTPAMAWLDREVAFRLAQWASAAALMWIGLSTAGLLPSISVLDRLLAPVSNVLARAPLPRSHRYVTALVGGLAWGMMPCAMVYGALFTALLSGSALGGGTIMLAFGVGTLPGLAATVAGYRSLTALAEHRELRLAAGLAIGLLGFLTVWVPHADSGAICAPDARSELTQVNSGPRHLP